MLVNSFRMINPKNQRKILPVERGVVVAGVTTVTTISTITITSFTSFTTFARGKS